MTTPKEDPRDLCLYCGHRRDRHNEVLKAACFDCVRENAAALASGKKKKIEPHDDCPRFLLWTVEEGAPELEPE